ncbi:hypothetical protein TNCV_5018911 [Trichonephila clavipes]|nr:hypothetical protein TNCV_5018911 [Trichonephila clavipes]
MAASLSIRTRCGAKHEQIIRRMQAQYGDSCLPQSEIHEGIERLEQGRTSLRDNERSGSSSTSAAKNNVEVVEGIVTEEMANTQVQITGAASSEWALYQNHFGPFFRYESLASGIVVIHVRAPLAWGPRIIDAAVATPLILDHLTPSLLVPTDEVVSRVFIESSALKHVVTIHSGMASERAHLISSQAKPMEVYVQIVMSGG